MTAVTRYSRALAWDYVQPGRWDHLSRLIPRRRPAPCFLVRVILTIWRF